MTAREPVDVAELIMDRLAGDLGDRFPELAFALELPSTWSLGSKPVLVVANDGGPLRFWPIATAPTIRVTSWTSGRDPRYVYAAFAHLMTARIPGIRAVLPGSGFIEDRDESTGGDLMSFTVRTRARTKTPA